MKKLPLLFIFFLVGCFSLCLQTLLIREYLISLEGNELAIGIFYATWFLWVATGATLIILKQGLSRYFFTFLTLYPVFAILEFYLFQILRKIAGIPPWQLFIITRIIPVTIVANMPFSFLTGVIFSSGCRFLKTENEKNSKIVSQAYIWESSGSFLAGVMITYLITKLFSPLYILLILSFIFLSLSTFVCFSFKKRISGWLTLLTAIIYLFMIYKYPYLEKFAYQARWTTAFPKGKIIASLYTPYQHLAIAEVKNQKVLLSNAKVVTALGDRISGDQLAALFSAMTDLPQKILIIGYGCENLIYSFLKYPINKIYYVVPDRNYIQFVARYLPPEMKDIFSKIEIFYSDPRIFISHRNEKFDLIILNIPDPSNSFWNKYYTLEFYKLVNTHLNNKGAIALKIISAENYIGTELKNYGSSIYYTLKKCFPKIVITPGRINWFFAGGKDSVLSSDPEILGNRYQKFMPLDSTFYPEGFKTLLLPERVKFIRESYAHNLLFEKFKLINSDKKPLSYFLNLIVQFRYANSRLPLILKSTLVSGWLFYIFPILLLFILRIHYLNFMHNLPSSRMVFSGKCYQLFSGCSGFIYQLILIYLFQNRFGTIFHYIGLVNSIFMLGLFTGSYLGKNITNKLKVQNTILTILIIQFILYICSYPLLIEFSPRIPNAFAWAIYSFLFLFSGIITGISYPLAGKILEANRLEILNISGNLEALDHWGAVLGSMLAGIILIPLLGIYRSLLFLSLLTLFLISLLSLDILNLPQKIRKLNPEKLNYPYPVSSYLLFGLCAWIIFSANYLEIKEKLLIQPEISIPGFGKIEKREIPFTYYLGYKGNKNYYIFRTRDLNTSGKGFGGDIDLIIVTDNQGKIFNITVEKSRESFQQMKQIKSWLKHFKGKYIYSPFQLGKNIDGVTGATITANGVISGINKTAQKVNILFSVKTNKIRINIDKSQALSSLILVIFIIGGLILYHRRRLSFKTRIIYLMLVIIILGVIFKLQLNTQNLLAILDFNFPSWNNFSLVLLLALPIILGVFYGRIYCGWFCPFGALQEILSKNKPFLVSQSLDRKLRFFKFLLLSVIIVFYFTTRNQNIFIQEPLYQTYFGEIGIDKILLVAVIVFAVISPRFWCKYFCPVGALLSLFNKIAILKLSRRQKIISCNHKVKNIRDPECLQCNFCWRNER